MHLDADDAHDPWRPRLNRRFYSDNEATEYRQHYEINLDEPKERSSRQISRLKQIPSPPPPLSRSGSHRSTKTAAKEKESREIRESRKERRKSELYGKHIPSPPRFRFGNEAQQPRRPSPPRLYQKRSTQKITKGRTHSPPALSNRRKSEIDIISTQEGHQFRAPHTFDGILRDKKPRRQDTKNLQVPLAVPGSFPSPPDTVMPEDSRSETSESRKASSSVGARSRISLPSVSGLLGKNVYQYQPLNDGEFRLIRVLPKTMSLIKCEIVHCSLDEPPDYTAISYAWGDAEDKAKIQVEGAVVPVSASLQGALFALRGKKKPILVWIDALSIDQQNKEERMQQVQQMTYIYSRAKSVAIWLGPEMDDSITAMRALAEISLKEVSMRPGTNEYMKHLISTQAGKAELASVVALFERDYWNRLWVVQEVFNGKNIMVYCGSGSVSWTVFRTAAEVFWRYKSQIDYYFPGGIIHSEQRNTATQFTYSQVLVYHGPSSIPSDESFEGLGEEALLEVLRSCRSKLTSDPKDKLYGILGLLEEEIRNEFPADYDLSIKEVYVRAFDYLICTTERLDVLCEAIHFPLHTGSNLPSWVPDWSYNPETTALGRSFDFTAAGDTKADAVVLDDHKRLEISALYIDTVRVHGIAVGTLCTLADYIMAFIHWRALLLGSCINGEHPERQEEFCRTLSLGQHPESDHEAWRNTCYHVFASLAQERLPRLLLDKELLSHLKHDCGIKREDRRGFLQEHFGAYMMGRSFCLTGNGLMGMGSGFMNAGDMVVIPPGCPTPILIRPEGSKGEYRYVGDVYIRGYMHGEAIDEWKDRKLELHKYVLR